MFHFGVNESKYNPKLFISLNDQSIEMLMQFCH